MLIFVPTLVQIWMVTTINGFQLLGTGSFGNVFEDNGAAIKYAIITTTNECEILSREVTALNILNYNNPPSTVHVPKVIEGYSDCQWSFDGPDMSKSINCYKQPSHRLFTSQQLNAYEQFHSKENFVYCTFSETFINDQYGDKEKLLDNTYPISPQEVIQLYFQLKDVINLLHLKDMVYCDLHPANIIVKNEVKYLKLYLIDFGMVIWKHELLDDNDQNVDRIWVSPTELTHPIVFETLYDLQLRKSMYRGNREQVWKHAQHADNYALASLFADLYIQKNGARYPALKCELERVKMHVRNVMAGRLPSSDDHQRKQQISQNLRLMHETRKNVLKHLGQDNPIRNVLLPIIAQNEIENGMAMMRLATLVVDAANMLQYPQQARCPNNVPITPPSICRPNDALCTRGAAQRNDVPSQPNFHSY